MNEWWSAMDLLMKSIWCTAIFTSLVFIIQSILTFAVMDSDGGLGSEADGMGDGVSGPFQLFTFRNFINFFLGTSWALIVFEGTFQSHGLWIALSVSVGMILVAAVMLLFRMLGKMEQSGTIDISNAVNCKGSVYLTIPGRKEGAGKVQITIQGAVREYDAITEGDRIETGAPITVKEIFNGNTLVVEKY